MSSKKHILADSLFTLFILSAVFLINLFLVDRYDTKTMTPMIFVLAVNWAWATGCWMPGIDLHRIFTEKA